MSLQWCSWPKYLKSKAYIKGPKSIAKPVKGIRALGNRSHYTKVFLFLFRKSVHIEGSWMPKLHIHLYIYHQKASCRQNYQSFAFFQESCFTYNHIMRICRLFCYHCRFPYERYCKSSVYTTGFSVIWMFFFSNLNCLNGFSGNSNRPLYDWLLNTNCTTFQTSTRVSACHLSSLFFVTWNYWNARISVNLLITKNTV